MKLQLGTLKKCQVAENSRSRPGVLHDSIKCELLESGHNDLADLLVRVEELLAGEDLLEEVQGAVAAIRQVHLA